MWSLRFGIRRIAIAHNERCSAQRSWLSRVSLALFAFLELLSQAALTGRRLFVPVISDPGDWLRCAAQRQPAPHVAEAVHQRFDIFIAVQRGREVDRLHLDPLAVQQLVASGLAEVGVADDHRNDVARRAQHWQTGLGQAALRVEARS